MILNFYSPFVYFIGWTVICVSVLFVFGVLPLWYIGKHNAEQRKRSKQICEKLNRYYYKG